MLKNLLYFLLGSSSIINCAENTGPMCRWLTPSAHDQLDRNGNFLGIAAEKFIIPPMPPRAATVLDVGAGDGQVTEQLVQRFGPQNVWALEPDPIKYASLRNRLPLVPQNQLINSTLQDAVDRMPSSFDVVTVFKYNVPLRERDAFIARLAQVIKPNGTVYITSVERERVLLVPGQENLMLLPALTQHFIVKAQSLIRDPIVRDKVQYALLELEKK